MLAKIKALKNQRIFFADCTAPFEVNFKTDVLFEPESANRPNAGKNYF